MWPGGPEKSIHAPPPVIRLRSTGRWVTRSTVATDSVLRPSIEYGSRRSAPEEPSGSSPLPTVARANSRTSLPPPKIFVAPFLPTSVALSTTLPARRVASTSALSALIAAWLLPEVSANSMS